MKPNRLLSALLSLLLVFNLAAPAYATSAVKDTPAQEEQQVIPTGPDDTEGLENQDDEVIDKDNSSVSGEGESNTPPNDTSGDGTAPDDPGELPATDEDTTGLGPLKEDARGVLYDAEYDINTASAVINKPGNYLIRGDGTPTGNRIQLSNGTYDITLDNVNIDMSNVSTDTSPDEIPSPFSVDPGTDVTLTIKEGTESTLRARAGAAGLQSLYKDDYTWTMNFNDRVHTYTMSTLTITGDGVLNIYGGDSSDSQGESARNGIGYIGKSEVISAGSGYYGTKRNIDTAQGPVIIEGNVTINTYGGNVMEGSSNGSGTGIGESENGKAMLPEGQYTITIQGSAVVNAFGGEDYVAGEYDYVASGDGIGAKTHITGDATVVATGGGTRENNLMGGNGIAAAHQNSSSSDDSILIDGSATVKATGHNGGAGIGWIGDGTIDIGGNAIVEGRSDDGSGIGGVGGNYSTGASVPQITIYGFADVTASGGGGCSVHDSNYYVYSMGAGCDTTATIVIKEDAVVSADGIGGSYDSYITVTGNAKVSAWIESRYNVSAGSGYPEYGGSATISGNVSVGSVAAAVVSLSDHAVVTTVYGEGATISDYAVVTGDVYSADVILTDSAVIYMKTSGSPALQPAITPRTTPLIAIDCGPCAVTRDIVLDNGSTSRTVSIPAGFRGAVCGVPAGEYTITRAGYSYSDANGGSSFTIALSDEAIYPIMVTCVQKTLAYSVGAGSPISPQKTDIGTGFVRPTDPSITGYIFAGWYADAGFTTAFDFEAPAIEDATAYAKLTPRDDTQYKVVHKLQSIAGTEYFTEKTEAFSGTTDSTVTATANDYTGFTRVGELPQDTIAANGSTVLTVKYDRNLYSINCVDTGGSPQELRFGSVPVISDPQKEGYTFCGWYLDYNYQKTYSRSLDSNANDTWNSNTGGNNHIISTTSDWDSFTSYVNNGGPTKGHTFLLDRDISFNSGSISTVDKPFEGTFDGRGYTLAQFAATAPLFSVIDDNGKIKSTTFSNGTLTITDKSALPISTGLVAGTNKGIVSTVEAYECSVSVTRGSNVVTAVGGLVGSNEGTLEYSCFYKRDRVGQQSYQVKSFYPKAATPTLLRQGGLVGENTGNIIGVYASVNLYCDVGGSAVGNYIYFSALVGLNSGTIQNTYFRFPFDHSGDFLMTAYRNVDGSLVSGQTLFVDETGKNPDGTPIHPLENTALLLSAGSGTMAFFVEEGRLKLFGTLPDTRITQNTTLYAKWTPATDTPYTVKHFGQTVDGAGYELVETESLTGTTGAAITATAKAHTGFTQVGNLPSGTISADGSLVLEIYYDRNLHSIRFSSNGGTDVDDILDIRYGSFHTAPVAPTKLGFDFSGWCSDSALTTDFSFGTAITADMTLYAKWNPKGDTAYTVEHYTRNLNDTDYSKADTQNLSGTTGASATATQKAYPGFAENESHVDRIPTGNIAPDGSLVLRLYYDRVTYTVTFDPAQGEVAPATKGILFGAAYGSLPVPTKSGYTFDGWFTAPTGDERVTAETVMSHPADSTVFARWVAISYPSAPAKKHTISVNSGAGGTITPSGEVTVVAGRHQSFTVLPDDGYSISDVLVDGVSVGAVSTFRFEKVKENHTITATFQLKWNPFDDVVEDDWFYAYVKAAYEAGLIRGTEHATFAPHMPTDRAMVATILHRLSAAPTLKPSLNSIFTDVPVDMWYTAAVAWGAETGILMGYNNGMFGPEHAITREQLAVMLHRYAGSPVVDTSANLSGVSDWARQGIAWAVETGLLAGDQTGNLMPQKTATRAEVATILVRFITE